VWREKMTEYNKNGEIKDEANALSDVLYEKIK